MAGDNFGGWGRGDITRYGGGWGRGDISASRRMPVGRGFAAGGPVPRMRRRVGYADGGLVDDADLKEQWALYRALADERAALGLDDLGAPLPDATAPAGPPQDPAVFGLDDLGAPLPGASVTAPNLNKFTDLQPLPSPMPAGGTQNSKSSPIAGPWVDDLGAPFPDQPAEVPTGGGDVAKAPSGGGNPQPGDFAGTLPLPSEFESGVIGGGQEPPVLDQGWRPPGPVGPNKGFQHGGVVRPPGRPIRVPPRLLRPRVPQRRHVGYAAGGPVNYYDDDTIYPTTSIAGTPSPYEDDTIKAGTGSPFRLGGDATYRALLAIADARRRAAGYDNYRRGGPVRRRMGYQQGGEVTDSDELPSSLRQVLDYTRRVFGLGGELNNSEYAAAPRRGYQFGGEVEDEEEQLSIPAVAAGDDQGAIQQAGFREEGPAPTGPSPVQRAKDMLKQYLEGARGLAPERLQQEIQNAARGSPDDDHNAHIKNVFDRFVSTGAIDDASRMLQSLRAPHTKAVALAEAAFNNGDIDGAIKLAENAHTLIPDGRLLKFMRNSDDSITAVVQRTDSPNAEAQSYRMNMQQFRNYLIGPATQFDHEIENGPEKNLDILVSKTPAPVTGYDFGTNRAAQPSETIDDEAVSTAVSPAAIPREPAAPVPTPTPDFGTNPNSLRSEVIDDERNPPPLTQAQWQQWLRDAGPLDDTRTGPAASRQPPARTGYQGAPGPQGGAIQGPYGDRGQKVAEAYAAQRRRYEDALSRWFLNPQGRRPVEPKEPDIPERDLGPRAAFNRSRDASQSPPDIPKTVRMYTANGSPIDVNMPRDWDPRNMDWVYTGRGGGHERVYSQLPPGMQDNVPPGQAFRAYAGSPIGAAGADLRRQMGAGAEGGLLTGYQGGGQEPTSREDSTQQERDAWAFANRVYPSDQQRRKDLFLRVLAGTQKQDLDREKLERNDRSALEAQRGHQRQALEDQRQGHRLTRDELNNLARADRAQRALEQRDRYLEFRQRRDADQLEQRLLTVREQAAVRVYNSAIAAGRTPPEDAEMAVQKLLYYLNNPGAAQPEPTAPAPNATTAPAPVAPAPNATTAPRPSPAAPAPSSVTTGWKRNADGTWSNPAFPNQRFDDKGQPAP